MTLENSRKPAPDAGAFSKNSRSKGFMPRMRRFARDQKGAGAIMFAFALPVLVGFTGLAIEGGMWYVENAACRRLRTPAH